MAIVFQYGSNCNKHRLNSPERLNGDATWIGKALTINKYQLGFTVFSKTNNCAAADIISGSGRRIWGILYEIPDYLITRQTAGTRRSLDEIEGEGTNYKRITIDVQQPNRDVLIATTYVARIRTSGYKTSLQYVEHIIKGLREDDVPDDYVEYVKQCVANNNFDLVKSVALL